MKLYDFRHVECRLDGMTCDNSYTADCVDCKVFKEYQKRIKLIQIRNIGAKSSDKEE